MAMQSVAQKYGPFAVVDSVGVFPPQYRAVANADRSTSLYMLRTRMPNPGKVFVMLWEGRTIPFEALDDVPRDFPLTYKIDSFGYSGYLKKGEPGAYVFGDADERVQALYVAAALLIEFGRRFNGTSLPDGAVRIVIPELSDVPFTRSDFAGTSAEADR